MHGMHPILGVVPLCPGSRRCVRTWSVISEPGASSLGRGLMHADTGVRGKGKALRIPAPYVIWGFREAVVHGMAVGFSGVVIRIHDHAPASAMFGCSNSGGLWV